jgi:protein-disulfide isomerase
MTIARLALLAALLLPLAPAGAATKPVAHKTAPAASAQDWTHVAAATPDGGIRIGNPAAKVKLVEYFSYTCPHCAAFAGEAYPKILQDYVAKGQTSFELRSALRDPIDFTVALTARAAKPADYVALVQAIMAKQQEWEPKAVDYIGAHRDELNGPNKVKAIRAMLGSVGLEAIAQQHGVTGAQIEQVLGDKALEQALGKSTDDAWNVRKIGGTPGFLVNDALQQNVFGWEQLEPKIQAALKG